MVDDRTREQELRGRPELSAPEVRKRLWSNPGGEEQALREAKTGAEADVDGHSEETAAETPETTKRLSDAHIDEPEKGTPGLS